MRLRQFAATLALLAIAAPALAGMRTERVEWTLDDTRFEGVLVHDETIDKPRPGLVLVPNWHGISEDAIAQAKDLAGDDYVVLVADLYGADVRPEDTDGARQASAPLREDRALMRARMGKVVDVLRAQAGRVPLDPSRIAAVGFCFGGTAVLELARSGSDVAGVVSLHGGLGTPMPAGEGVIDASVLVLNGADDAGVTDEDIDAFKQEMDAAGADWQFVEFSGAVHCFAEPSAGDGPGNCRYDPRAAARAYEMLRDFLVERLEVR